MGSKSFFTLTIFYCLMQRYLCCVDNFDTYLAIRDGLIAEDRSKAIGAGINLTCSEQRVNNWMMAHKTAEIVSALRRSANYPVVQDVVLQHWVQKYSRIHHLLRNMPKGALLHTHSHTLASLDYVYSLTYENHLYVCRDESKPFMLKFFREPDCTCAWELVKDVRKTDPLFSVYLRDKLTLLKNEPYDDTLDTWKAIRQIAPVLSSLVKCRHIFEEYLHHSLTELYNDGIIYVEIRCTLRGFYDLDGKVYETDEVVDVYRRVAKKFKAAHPDWIGMKVIYGKSQISTDEEMKLALNDAIRLREKYGDFVAGFTMYGIDEASRPIKEYAKLLYSVKDVLPLYLHAGVTNEFGGVDENIYDAALLSSRLGYACTLSKYPALIEKVLGSEVAVEVNPTGYLSLQLVNDIRTHSSVIMAAKGLPLVVINDNPTLWGTKGVTDDWYLMLMGVLHQDDGLAALKELALTSIVKSAMLCGEKDKALKVFERQWHKFIHSCEVV